MSHKSMHSLYAGKHVYILVTTALVSPMSHVTDMNVHCHIRQRTRSMRAKTFTF